MLCRFNLFSAFPLPTGPRGVSTVPPDPLNTQGHRCYQGQVKCLLWKSRIKKKSKILLAIWKEKIKWFDVCMYVCSCVMHVCVFICVCVSVYVFVNKHACMEVRRLCLWVLVFTFHPVWDRISCCSLLDTPSSLACELQGYSSFHFSFHGGRSIKIRATHVCLCWTLGSEDLNSGSHTCVATALLTESSPYPITDFRLPF